MLPDDFNEWYVRNIAGQMVPFSAIVKGSWINFGAMLLAISSGAGLGGQNTIGTGVIGGMIAATLLAIFLVPLFFVVMLRFFRVPRRKIHDDDEPGSAAPVPIETARPAPVPTVPVTLAPRGKGGAARTFFPKPGAPGEDQR